LHRIVDIFVDVHATSRNFQRPRIQWVAIRLPAGLDEDFFLPIVLPFNDGRDNGDIHIETAAESLKPGKHISICVTGKLIGSSSNVCKVWSAALGWWWHTSFPFSCVAYALDGTSRERTRCSCEGTSVS